jgi:N-dimethylarginine dimethylaminohydrolase
MSVLMCSPEFYTVEYTINPWMHPEVPTDTSLAVTQWQSLRDTYDRIGVEVQEITPVRGLPDMVYAANGATVLDGICYTASFRYPERQPEGELYARWLADAGYRVVQARAINEGEGDFLAVGDAIFAGTGFRSTLESHQELREVFGREVVTMTLVRPQYYHLDTCLSVLDARPGQELVAYLPSAFAPDALAELESRFPDAIIVDEDEAAVLGLNLVSNGADVVMPVGAPRYQQAVAERGFTTHTLDLSELRKGGGGIKCCTLTLR